MVENIRHFVTPLRANHLSQISPIVILHEEKPNPKQWSQLCLFPQIYFVKGSALNEKNLDRVNIRKAKQVVILCPSQKGRISGGQGDDANQEMQEEDPEQEEEGEENNAKSENDDENLLDAQTIFKYNMIKKKNKNVNVVTELFYSENLAYLLDDPNIYHTMKEFGYDQTPTFASGEVYLSSLMDSLICQAYFNPALITVLK